MRRLIAWGGAGLLVAGHVGPAATWLPSVRLAFAPRLAGLGRSGHVALTFDDGPDRTATPLFLAELERLGWAATFFVVGERARADPTLITEIAAAGHEIGVHGDRHRHLLGRDPAGTLRDLRRARDGVGDLLGSAPVWFRPPYGVLTGAGWMAARSLGLTPVLWSAWGRDWLATATPRSVLAELRAGILSGGTALLHDSDAHSAPGAWRAALGALPLLAEETAMRRLEVGPLAEHGLFERHRAGSAR